MSKKRNKKIQTTQLDFIKNHPELKHKELCEILNISPTSITNMRKQADTQKNRKWTSEQIEFIKQHITETDRWISENIPGPKKTIRAIQGKRKGMSIINCKSRQWKPEQIKFLKDNESKTNEWIYENMPGPKKTTKAIQRKKSKQYKRDPYEPWTTEQDKFIKDHKSKTDEWLAENIPGPERTKLAIRCRRKVLNIYKHKSYNKQPLKSPQQ